MFETTLDLKEFILWCQQAKIKAVKVGDVEVQFSDLAFLDVIAAEPETSKALEKAALEEQAVEEKEQQQEDEELLFWSSKS